MSGKREGLRKKIEELMVSYSPDDVPELFADNLVELILNVTCSALERFEFETRRCPPPVDYFTEIIERVLTETVNGE